MREPFVGRDRELAELLSGLEDALRGRGSVFLIAGEAGIGKSALAEQVADRAAERGAQVAWGRGWEGGSTAPYWIWAQVIRAVAEGLDDETLRTLFARPGAAHLAPLVPELAERYGRTGTSLPVLDRDADRFYLFEAAASFLKHAASVRPVLLVLDDLLAGDQPSLLLLRFLTRDVPTSHLMLLATYRDAEAARSSEALNVLADMNSRGRLLRLTGLGRDEVRKLIAEIARVEPWEGKVAAIHEATGGNPLYVREVTRLVAATDALERPGRLTIPIPDTVRAVIRRRLASLSADAVQVLSAAAVVGREFDVALVGAASGLTSERVLDSLSQAVGLQVVEDVSQTGSVYRFSHPLMREAIYEGLPLPARMQMHQRVGEAIERLHRRPEPSPRRARLPLRSGRSDRRGRQGRGVRAPGRRSGDGVLRVRGCSGALPARPRGAALRPGR